MTIRVLGLHGVAPLAGWAERRGILLLYTAEPVAGEIAAADDVSEVAWFTREEIPWDELAFESTAQFLREWIYRLICFQKTTVNAVIEVDDTGRLKSGAQRRSPHCCWSQHRQEIAVRRAG